MDIFRDIVISDAEDNADIRSENHIDENQEYLIESIVEEEPEMSVMETLRSLQKDNPQVETIFVESDEEEDESLHSIQETRTVTPRQNVLPNNRSSAQTSNSSQTSTLTLPNNPSTSQTNNLNQASTFMVREISPAMLTPNIVSNANTIALFDESKGAASRSYLVIPQDIIPILARSKGPVSLNVPGVGPLVIPKPSDMLLLQKNVNSQISTQVSAPSSSSVVPEVSGNPISEKTDNSVYHRPYNPLNDPKHKCWIYRKGLKRDLDGFSLKDRLGFSKAEQRRANVCVYTCNDVVKKLENSINMLKRKLLKIKVTKIDTNRFKFTGIDKSTGKRGRWKRQQENDPDTVLSATEQKNLHTLLSWKERFGQSSENDFDDDLLLTKKVVFVNGRKRKGKNKKKESNENQNQKKKDQINFEGKKKKTNSNRKSKRTTRGKLPKKFTSEKESTTPPKIEFVDVNTVITPVKRKRGRPKKLKTINKKQLHYQQIYNITPCSVEISPIELEQETLDTYKKYYMQELITTSKEFCKRIDRSKPILVLNEKQCAKLNLAELQERNNLVFPTQEICFSNSFIETTKIYNIKFVKPDILCKYLAAAGSN